MGITRDSYLLKIENSSVYSLAQRMHKAAHKLVFMRIGHDSSLICQLYVNR